MKQSAGEWMNRMTAWAGKYGTDFHTQEDGWQMLEDAFKSFSTSDSWGAGTEDFNDWKARFPYHSFLSKAGGADPAHSPKSRERFLVCFGLRVASDLHRRPSGSHIITDQNNV